MIQDSRMYGGKVGVYAFDAPRVVVRSTSMEGMMVGVFDLYSPRLLVANSSIEETWNGIYAETQSYGNAIVGNYLHNNVNGIIIEGRTNFVARNTMIHNQIGMQVHGQYSLYWRNLIAFNSIGAESGALLPLNQVIANDFLANRQAVSTQRWNVLHVWPSNFCSEALGMNFDGDCHLKRAYRPTGVVGSRLGTHQGARTLARSLAVTLIRRLGNV
ncbi:MAG: NosD domain-containing protein, partial [Halobacteriaceae archaeon]